MKHLLFLGILFAAFHVSSSATPDFCRLTHDEGKGPSFLYALYYDPISDLCNPFIYKGEGGNENRFQTERDCIRNCSANADATYPTEASKACLLKKNPGDCSGRLLSFYYDPIHDKCKGFYYTGCHGNGNRFSDYFRCNSTCAGIHVDGDEEEEVESDTPIAIICGVVLAVIITAVLITVIVLTVKSKKKSTKKKAQQKSKEPQTESPLNEKGIEMA
ncbi:boophilin-G2 [Anabas testudineus]|uniref:boophilin-G2 n=1 Tax=Anabas testudineus TaxID=64144 RepID=UPI000E4623B3|nr:boophilin-G2 [Anabas testudineus]